MRNRVRLWLLQIRGPFLILSVMLVLIGIAAAHAAGNHHFIHSSLLLLGVVLAHVSVNLFNELSDFQTGIDAHTRRTPFSGGSGLLQAGKTTDGDVRIVAYGSMLIATGIGVYFCIVVGWVVLPLMLMGGLAIRFYTSHLARWLLGEFMAGLSLGSFVVIGSYYVLTGMISMEIVLLSIPPGLLTTLLLFLNEFPDAEADRKGGRHHLIIHLGKRISARWYAAGLFLVYSSIIIIPFLTALSFFITLGLLTLPLAVKAGMDVFRYFDETEKLIPALGLNVGVVILTDLLLSIGLFVS